MIQLILLNAGGRHIKVIKDIISAQNKFNIYAIIDNTNKQIITKENTIHANHNFLEKIDMQEYKFCITIGSNHMRKITFENSQIPIHQYATLVHPSAVISPSATLGYGTVVMPNAVVNADAIIGNHCIINTNAIIEHDCVIEDFVHISPGVTFAGGIRVGKGAHIGSGASLIPEVKIGNWSTIGAGAVVINDVKPHTTAVGVPAKVIKKNT